MAYKGFTQSSFKTSDYGMPSKAQEKMDLQGLNERFASHLHKLRQMSLDRGSMDATSLLNSIKSLENELQQLRDMYEAELNSVRRDLQECCRLRAAEKTDAESFRNKLRDAEQRLMAACDLAKKLETENNRLRPRIAELESQLALSRESAAGPLSRIPDLEKEIAHLRGENDNLKRKIEQLLGTLGERDNRVDMLEKELQFTKKSLGKENGDLQNRLDNAGKTIQDLEYKLKQPVNMQSEVPFMLEKARQQAADEIRKQSSDNLNRLNGELNQVRDHAGREADRTKALEAENARLRGTLDDIQNRLNAAEGNLISCCKDREALKKALDQERAQAQAELDQCNQKGRALQNNLMEKIQELNECRENCLPLRAEIENYKVLLDEDEKCISSLPKISQKSAPTYASAPVMMKSSVQSYSKGPRGDPCLNFNQTMSSNYSNGKSPKADIYSYCSSQPSSTIPHPPAPLGNRRTTYTASYGAAAPREACCSSCTVGGQCDSKSGGRFY